MRTYTRIPFLIILGLGLLVAAPTRAQQAAEAVETHDEGPSEGIHVSGLWTFEIYEPDGTLVEKRTIENALTLGGTFMLTQLLSRSQSTGLWRLTVSSDMKKVCVNDQGPIHFCRITEPAENLGAADGLPNIFRTLHVSTTSASSGMVSLVLQGNFTASLTGEISGVESANLPCDPNVAPTDCPNFSWGFSEFTTRVLDTPIEVQEGQQVEVTVVIGFN